MYQKKDYERLLNTEKNKSIELWAWKNDKAAAEFAILCAKDIKNVTLTASDLSGNADVISSSKVQLAFHYPRMLRHTQVMQAEVCK